jgi:GcrA cell cycle regulator
MNFTWTDTAIAELKRLWLDGYSASQCAVAMTETFREPISRNAVIGKVYRLGISRPDEQGTGDKARSARRASARAEARRTYPARPRTPKQVAPEAARAAAPRVEVRPWDPGPAAVAVAVPVAPPKPPALPPTRPTLFTVRDTCCRFPLWPNGPAPHPRQAFVCGEPVVTADGSMKPYCAEHARVCWSKLQPAPVKAPAGATSKDKAKRRDSMEWLFRKREAA